MAASMLAQSARRSLLTGAVALTLLALVTPAAAQSEIATDENGFCEDTTKCWWYGGLQAKGEQTQLTFEEPGTYAYHCHSHGWMEGTVKVVPKTDPEREPATVTVRIIEPKGEGNDAWGFAPEVTTITAGDTVVFFNSGDAKHDVMVFAGGEEDHHADEDHDHGSHDHGEPKETPGIGLLAPIIGAAGLALFGRRRE